MLVLFLGLELMIESLWESAKTLTWSEWATVVGTLLACTFLGFAPGFGVGIALAILMYVLLAAIDTVSTPKIPSDPLDDHSANSHSASSRGQASQQRGAAQLPSIIR